MAKKRKRPKHKFTDEQGREYTIVVTFPLLRWIRDELDCDLGQSETFIALSRDLISCVNVLYCLCKEQADKYGIDDREFGESLAGDSLAAAWEAFSQAYLSFCPSHQAKLLRRLVAAAEKTELMGVMEFERQMSQLADSFSSDLRPPQSPESQQTATALEN